MTISKKELRKILLQETNRELGRPRHRKLNRSQLRNIISETVVSLDEGKPDPDWGDKGDGINKVNGVDVYRRHKRPYEYTIVDGEWHGRKIGSKGKYRNVHKYVAEKFKVEFKDAPVGDQAKKEEEEPPSPKDGKCPEDWVLSDDGETCVKKEGRGGTKEINQISTTVRGDFKNQIDGFIKMKSQEGGKKLSTVDRKFKAMITKGETDSGRPYSNDDKEWMKKMQAYIRKNNYLGGGKPSPHAGQDGCWKTGPLGDIPLKDIPTAKHILAKDKRDKDDYVNTIKICYNKPKPKSAEDFTRDKIRSIDVELGRAGDYDLKTSKDYYVRGKQITDADLNFLKAMIKFK